ncbi:PREDICTED: cell division cycle-associated protein 7-like [Cyprinodon variegatus]|uniref:cell division cycle-associated protein 7-like n=1 Tax=Cyprinodon variegatus TaxID=28743 RepID=UPI00074272C1|nr:PREDICTED: cell division cycle-associated protein 7-like [Cyprinodon variegatus]
MSGKAAYEAKMKNLAEVFAEDSDSAETFDGFSDSEVTDTILDIPHEAQPNSPPMELEATSEPPGAHEPFRLRIALRPAPSLQLEYEDAEEESDITSKRGVKRPREPKKKKKGRRVKFEDKETAVSQPYEAEEHGSGSASDESDNFLAKREKNIKANKAMLAQLMADLQKMTGGVGVLKKQSGRQTTKRKSPCAPHRALIDGESRRNPERASRRQTRSMGGIEDPPAQQQADVELTLEEELLEVHRAPRRRGAPRPNQSKPHIIRPVEDITTDELELVADNMTDKVYNSVTGSTCHQCRQKTVDTKTCCRSESCRGIQGQFCGPCLRNRYGEDVKKALLDPDWKCPPCRGICNCSFCRQREGRCPTGILFPLAQYHGFSNVHSYLSSLREKLEVEEKTEM